MKIHEKRGPKNLWFFERFRGSPGPKAESSRGRRGQPNSTRQKTNLKKKNQMIWRTAEGELLIGEVLIGEVLKENCRKENRGIP